jgi:hypothetical protein
MSSRFLSIVILAAGLAAGSFAIRAEATSVEGMSLRDLVVHSPSVVRGTVLGSASHWNDDRSLIVTDVQVRVDEVLKGQPVSLVTLTEPGGRVGALRVDVDGASAFPDGGEVVLFLSTDRRGNAHVTGLFQGRFDVTRDPKTGVKTVRGLPPAAAGSGPQGAPGVHPEPSGKGRPVLLDDFLAGVKAMVRDVNAKGGK